jgi:hypothetical protein
MLWGMTALKSVSVQAPNVSAGRHLAWLAGGLVLAFVVPFLFADLLGLPRDLYYGIYAATAVGFFLLWVRFTGQSLGAMLRRRWVLAVVLGLIFAAAMAMLVIRTEPASSGPTGVRLVWDVAWRGLVYGAVDGLFLSSFPILAVFAAGKGSRLWGRASGKVVVGIAALIASLLMAAVYHLGYSDFRSAKIVRPVAGDVIWSVPTLITLNPVGAPLAHAGMHIAAVLHSPQTDTFLPPHY